MENFDQNENFPQIGTPEYDALMKETMGESFEYEKRATFLTRFWATLIDGILILILQQGIYYLIYNGDTVIGNFGFSLSRDPEIQKLLQDRLVPIGIIIGLCYMLMEVFLASSPGKMLMKLQIGNNDATQASTIQLLIRSSYKNISNFILIILFATNMNLPPYSYLSSAFGIIVFVGCLFALSEKRLALQDSIAKTAVYKTVNINFEN